MEKVRKSSDCEENNRIERESEERDGRESEERDGRERTNG